MPQDDILEIEILEDGTIRSTTPHISNANHKSADEFFKFMAEKCGGPVEKTKRKHGHHHQHDSERIQQ